ncbi:integrase catalytic domain-containing protein [Trichonephila clavipes]|uniref:Integrase catalytic domain-containing protein n=1 Tax=Trichonephila clavipes TaxID=2585209 RepID=A0A8X6RQM5_TRICX|nr:integrase catalytic domain-containing protein [Trichonephila clavipes]
MKQKQQTKNKHSGSARARSDQWIMDKQNRIKSTLEVEKLDRESRRNFQLSLKSKTVPTFQEFIEFLEQRESVLLSVSVDRNAKVNPNKILNAIAFCSDIKQAFLQICLADEHKDAVRFLWRDDEPCVHKRPKLQVYRFNRVNFGVSSSPFLLAVTIRHHIEKYKHEFPDTVELLDRNFCVDDLISGGNEFEEALQTSRRAKNIMEAAGMDLRKWITNDANLMEQWKKENFNVHPVHETVSLGANGTKVLGLSWNTNEDYLTTDTKSLLEFVSLDKNTKRFILQAVGKIFDPLGLISPFTVRMKCLLQDLWKEEIQWDDPLPTHIEKEWKKWCEELPHLRNLKIPRLVLDSTLLEDDVDRVAPLNCVTLPRLELLGALVAARLASKGNKTRWKQFVANRVNEITSLTDPHSWYHCAASGSELDYLTEHEKETVVQEKKKLPEADRSEETALLNSDSSSILDELLELSNNYFKVINILSYIFRFNYNYGEGIVRVGGRLENASVPYLHKHPAILPKGSKLSKLYFNSLHTRLFHVGPQGLLNAVRLKFWPLSGRSIARKTVHQCVTCFKSRPILSSQIMGRILEVYHGSDGKVRVVKVKTQSGEFKRAISKIAVLPIDTK